MCMGGWVGVVLIQPSNLDTIGVLINNECLFQGLQSTQRGIWEGKKHPRCPVYYISNVGFMYFTRGQRLRKS